MRGSWDIFRCLVLVDHGLVLVGYADSISHHSVLLRGDHHKYVCVSCMLFFFLPVIYLVAFDHLHCLSGMFVIVCPEYNIDEPLAFLVFAECHYLLLLSPCTNTHCFCYAWKISSSLVGRSHLHLLEVLIFACLAIILGWLVVLYC